MQRPPTTTIFSLPHWLLMLIVATTIHGVLFMAYHALAPEEGAVDQGEQGIAVGLKVFQLPPQLVSPVQKKIPPKAVQKVAKVKPQPLVEPAPIVKPEPLVLEEPEPIEEPTLIEEEVIEETVVQEEGVEELPSEDETLELASTEPPVLEAEISGPEPVTEGVVDSHSDTQQHEEISIGGGNPVAQANYEVTLLSWLEKHKRYPSVAKRRGQQDIVELSFSIDAEGNVLSYEIVTASAFKSLNKAVEKMIKRASPLPAVPMELANYQAQFSYVVPVQFELQ